jgi:SPP1 family predicted phage head-tail adaptor
MDVEEDFVLSLQTLFNATVDIEAPVESKDSMGAILRTWTVRNRRVPCRIVPLSGTELIEWNRETVQATHKLYAFPIRGLTEAMRVNYGGRLFNIVLKRDAHEQGRFIILHLLERKTAENQPAGVTPGGGYGIGGYGA